MEQWGTVSEAARRAAVDPDTIRRWVDNGSIRALRTPGGHRRIDLGDLERYLRRGRRDADYSRVDPIEAAQHLELVLDHQRGWQPTERHSDDDLALARHTIERLRVALDRLEAVCTDTLHQRDRAAVRDW